MDAAPARPCAYCRAKPVASAWRPFCSERCKLLDLDHWLGGDYRVPGEPVTSGASPDDEPPETGADER